MNDGKTMNIIRGWGIPNLNELKNLDLEYKFDDIEIKNTKEKNHKCENDNVKFCLYDKNNEHPIFTMDFWGDIEGKSPMAKLMSGINNDNAYTLKLEILYVHIDELRKKGIASYYLDKLKKYALDNGYKIIKVNPIANDKKFKSGKRENVLTQMELEKFYKSKSDENIRFILKNDL